MKLAIKLAGVLSIMFGAACLWSIDHSYRGELGNYFGVITWGNEHIFGVGVTCIVMGILQFIPPESESEA